MMTKEEITAQFKRSVAKQIKVSKQIDKRNDKLKRKGYNISGWKDKDNSQFYRYQLKKPQQQDLSLNTKC